jgi:hypothetical protein
MKNIVHILLLTIFIAGSSQLSAFQYLEGNKVPSANNNDLLTHGMFRPNGSTSVYFQLIQENMLRSSDPEMQEPAYLNLYEPDLNLIKSFALRLPVEEAQLNYWAGGLYTTVRMFLNLPTNPGVFLSVCSMKVEIRYLPF